MKRRTILKRLGATGVATVGIAGAASASPAEGVDHEIDVSDVSGEVELAELLGSGAQPSPAALGRSADTRFVISEDADTITLSDCCEYCCKHPNVCDCLCCECSEDACQ